MSAPISPAARARRGAPPRPSAPSRLRYTLTQLGVLALVIVCLVLVDANWARLLEAPALSLNYGGLVVQGVVQNPFSEPYSQYWTDAILLMFESLQIAWIGTVIGAIFSFPIGFLAASNVSPRGVVIVTRQILNIIRAVPELVFAIAIMLPIFGLGPLAGALAIGVGSIGTLGKLTSEAIEAVPTGPGEATRSTGAGTLQTLRWAVTPQILPEVIAFWLYRFEINIRASAILGILGAGGVGSLLAQVFERRDWERIGITLTVIIVVTVIVDQISGAVRHRVISGVPVAGAKALV
ncbi:MAG: phosphonate ABC transporter, permease protein PhnE [Microcella pacifica]|uniref:Phosphonate ABC transporter, permease protein PhnE n=1 Tax=Microcella pacifica TaxID=2591847 RepID=A0A9E5JN77_9MICO|nr:phosphonate ABC transporter, permease protein PhnE [Microcella pacifica]MBR21614.1 phosphonate ABC transporter, permease protein PhnE [Leifsonia sp.]MBU1249596.1 phosphonate ABC transporter, permease protein PhnE [Actinomycetota bacterium]MBU1609721.1 phosphonate ABC transporter, permease protein PhnE [Actinomycetota bacterium]MBU2316226.1 phosphonate ABC transporter, permease protein PhnE [Actinomycetota bacterium]MBU2385702.1 phosphonate ABC transporter, permease protein PhnE [Actinomycet